MESRHGWTQVDFIGCKKSGMNPWSRGGTVFKKVFIEGMLESFDICDQKLLLLSNHLQKHLLQLVKDAMLSCYVLSNCLSHCITRNQ